MINLRYYERHSPGFTSLIRHNDLYITCGIDGKVIQSKTAQTKAELLKVDGYPLCLTSLENLLIIPSSNELNAYTDRGNFDKQIGKFNYEITCITADHLNQDIIIGFSDFKIKRINITTHKQYTFEGHVAPILTVDINKDSSFLASASCDGSIKIWDYEDLLCVYTFKLLSQSNSIKTAKSLGRLSWSPSSKCLAIPIEKEIKVYQIDIWKIKCSLNHPSMESFLNVSKFSPCEKFLGAGSTDGKIYIFELSTITCLHKIDLDKSIWICNLLWLPSSLHKFELYFTDLHGRLGHITSSDAAKSNTAITFTSGSMPSRVITRESDVMDHEVEDYGEDEDLDFMVREREKEEEEVEEEDSLLKHSGQSEEKDLEDISGGRPKIGDKKFGDYFREAALANPIGQLVRDNSSSHVEQYVAPDERPGLRGQGRQPVGISEGEDDDLDIVRVKEEYHRSLRKLHEGSRSVGPPGKVPPVRGRLNEGDTGGGIDASSHAEAKFYPRDGMDAGNVETRSRSIKSNLKHPPFQPGSTPESMGDRYMVWNGLGIIQSFRSEDACDEDSLEIEYFDKSIHHTMHITNVQDFGLGDMSRDAVVLAFPGGIKKGINERADDFDTDEDSSVLERVLRKANDPINSNPSIPGKFRCLHFSSWDSIKEWDFILPIKESIVGITLGTGWCAVASSNRIVRTFSIGGFQRLPLMIPGDIVCVTGFENELAIVYSESVSPNEYVLSLHLYHVIENRSLVNGLRIPLNPSGADATKITWIGFSETRNLYITLSSGFVMALLRSRGFSWIPVANTKSLVKNKSDTYWVTSIQEEPTQIRAILCKSSKYPLTLPRPTISILPFNLPLLEQGLDSTKLENDYWVKWLKGLGNEPRQSMLDQGSQQNLAEQANALIKLFALFCQSDQDFKAHEICVMMLPSLDTAKLAIKYATRVKKLALARRLTQMLENEIDEAEESSIRPILSNHLSSPRRKYEVSELGDRMELKEIDLELKQNICTPSGGRVSNGDTFDQKSKTGQPHFLHDSQSEGEDGAGEQDYATDATNTPSDLFTQSERYTVSVTKGGAAFNSKPNGNPFKIDPFKVDSSKNNTLGLVAMEREMDERSSSQIGHQNFGTNKRRKKDTSACATKSKVMQVKNKPLDNNGEGDHGDVSVDCVRKDKNVPTTLQQFFGIGGKGPITNSDTLNVKSAQNGCENGHNSDKGAQKENLTPSQGSLPPFQTWFKECKNDLRQEVESNFEVEGIDVVEMDEKEINQHLTKFAIKKYKMLKLSSS